MCELYLSASNHPHFPEQELRRLQRHGDVPWTNQHGWGIAWLRDDRSQFGLEKSPQSAADAKGYNALLDAAHSSLLYLVHLRAASTGGVRLANTQPYRFMWNGQPAIYIHNGELKGMKDRLERDLGTDPRQGKSDSEGGMFLLNDCLKTANTVETAWTLFMAWAQDMKSMGIGNFIVALGSHVFVHVHRRTELGGDAMDDPGLYLSQTDDRLRLSSEPMSEIDQPLVSGTLLWIEGAAVRDRRRTT